ncbi:hypothetical protein ACOMHN_012604 [Nucella lapillus]
MRESYESGETQSTRRGEVAFKKKNGVLVRKFHRDGETATQICLPAALRTPVLTLAHEAPLAGHLATQRTQDRLRPHFYWPGMFSETRRFCQSCVKCQKTVAKGRVPKVPLVRMPTIDTPFEQVAVDIIGPIIPRSRAGNRYVLVMVDYATRYPEATPLKEVTAEVVAEALFNMWTRTGIPAKVLRQGVAVHFSNDERGVQAIGHQGIVHHPVSCTV